MGSSKIGKRRVGLEAQAESARELKFTNRRLESEIAERKRAEEKILTLNKGLRERLAALSAELMQCQKQLEKESNEHEQTEKDLVTCRKELRSLASQLSQVEERQRQRIATGLHDSVSQALALATIKLESFSESAHGVDVQPLEEVCMVINDVIKNIRCLTFDLCSPMLHELGLEAAIAELVDNQSTNFDKISYEFCDDGEAKPVEQEAQALLFQSVRELLINIIKHAKAHKVKVAIRKDAGNIRITVSDDGISFDVNKVGRSGHQTGGFGLFNIRERLGYIGGSLEITSQAGKGSQVTLTAPLKI